MKHCAEKFIYSKLNRMKGVVGSLTSAVLCVCASLRLKFETDYYFLRLTNGNGISRTS